MIILKLLVAIVAQIAAESEHALPLIASTPPPLATPSTKQQRVHRVRYLGHRGDAELTSVPRSDLPKLFLNGAPWNEDLGTFWVGHMNVPSLGRLRCYLQDRPGGRAQGWVRASGFSARVRGDGQGDLELSPEPFPMDLKQGCAGRGSRDLLQNTHGLEAMQTSPPHCGRIPLTLAIETDVQFSARFPSTQEAAAWLTMQTLVAGDILGSQLGVDLEVPYLGLHQTQDVWTAPDLGGSAQELLEEFRALWPGLAPVRSHLSHFFSGVGNGTSLAGQDGVCVANEAFAVHTMRLDRQGHPDSRVLALAFLHGLGHNLGARHTHDYCPPLDSCNPLPPLGVCQQYSDCSSQGTIMSFCHLCPGGLDQVDLSFHPVNADAIWNRLEGCLPRRSPVLADAPETRAPGEDWVVQVATHLQLLEAPVLRYWGDAAQGEVTMVSTTPGRYEGRIPPASCGDVTRAQIQMSSATCGSVLWPEPGVDPLLENRVTELTPAFEDDFQYDLGWISVQGGALSGFWTRGIPVADPNWTIAPATDAGGDGWCFLTGNYYGNSDVDNGTVTLMSPPIPVESSPLQIEFDYFLGMVNENGEDRLTLECSWSGLNGPWTPVWRAGHDTQGQWVHVTLSETYLARWPQVLPGNLRLRFRARDGSPPSVMEAAVDSVKVSTGQCP